jgi:hypothetical protein
MLDAQNDGPTAVLLGNVLTSLPENTATPTLSGTAEAGTKVVVTLTQGTTAVVLSEVITANNNTWSVTPPDAQALANGTWAVSIAVSDGANTTTKAGTSFVIDNTAPSASTITGGLDASSNSGATNDFITNDTTPTLSGTAEAGTKVVVTLTQGTTAVVLSEVITSSNNTWSVTPPDAQALAQGVLLQKRGHTVERKIQIFELKSGTCFFPDGRHDGCF